MAASADDDERDLEIRKLKAEWQMAQNIAIRRHEEWLLVMGECRRLKMEVAYLRAEIEALKKENSK